LRRLFERQGEAYHAWNSVLPGYVAPNPAIGPAFDTEPTLRDAYDRARSLREELRGRMIALQEEMDWLSYSAYALLAQGHPAEGSPSKYESHSAAAVLPLQEHERPFRLWEQAEGDLVRAISLMPTSWPPDRLALWKARLKTIRDDEHIRRIEQPVYKRRWEEQWKIGNQWRCGEVAYAAEYADAFEWWLKEKAEWWLEHKKCGGPIGLGEWTHAMWKDDRVQAAWPVAAEQYALLEFEKARRKSENDGEAVSVRPPLTPDSSSFTRKFKEIVEEETVPEGFPFGVDYDKLKKAPSAKLKKVRGKSNVPKERFHSVGPGQYRWAGLQFRINPEKTSR
jgi:hypothetical protein